MTLRFVNNRLEPSGSEPQRYGGAIDAVNDDELTTLSQVSALVSSFQSQLDSISSNVSELQEEVDALNPPLTTTVTTTDATTTTIATIAVDSSNVTFVNATVIARRTGGSSGSAEDSASYIVGAAYKNVAGTATEVGEASTLSIEDQANWNVTIAPSGSNAIIQVAGAANNNVSWKCIYSVYKL